jgi:hypothetical protein
MSALMDASAINASFDGKRAIDDLVCHQVVEQFPFLKDGPRQGRTRSRYAMR